MARSDRNWLGWFNLSQFLFFVFADIRERLKKENKDIVIKVLIIGNFNKDRNTESFHKNLLF